MKIKLKSEKLFLFFYFIFVILIGTILLLLDISWHGQSKLDFIDALFTATSAVCVTGLITVKTADYSLIGQIIIMFLIQAGGLGIISFSTIYLALPARRISLKSRKVIREYYIDSVETEPLKIIKQIIIITIIIELLGTSILFLVFSRTVPGNSIFASLFHSVSAFCNAGFSLFSNNLEDYINNPVVSLTVAMLIVLGGIGFVVLQDIGRKIKNFKRKLALHTKIVLLATALLIVLGACLFFIFEFNNTLKSLSLGNKIIASLFQSITPRTAGFNTINQQALSFPSKVFTLPLMFIGGASGSIAGGIRVTTFFIVLLVALWGSGRKSEFHIFKRKISKIAVSRAAMFTIKAFLLVFSSVFLLTISELFFFNTGNKNFLSVVFETFSAFGTVGLSLGITSSLSIMGKIVIIFTMFSGRVGLISMAMPEPGRQSKCNYDYPTGEVLIG